MAKENNMFRIKIDYEDCPIVNTKTKGIKGLKKIFQDMEDKMG